MEEIKGPNRVEEFRKIADTLTSRIRSLDGVVGIVLTGALTRGFADKHSDLDMIILLGKRDEKLKDEIRQMGIDAQKTSGIDVDLEVHHIEDFMKERAHEYRKWDLSHSAIVYDSNGRTKEVLMRKTQLPVNYYMHRMVVLGEYLMWYCCPPAKNVQGVIETWIDRGDMISAHYSMNYALDLVIKMLFALNREFLPAPKWRVFYSYSLKWLPRDYRKLLEEALNVNNLSISDLNRRINAVRSMWRQILPRLKNESGLTPHLISTIYIKKILHQK